MKNKLRQAVQFIANPRLLLCALLAWMITNGWSYVLMGLGLWLGIEWMQVVAGAWLTFLWLPISPEKLVTFAIAIALLRWLFPDDQKTLAVLRLWYRKAKRMIHRKKAARAARKEEKKAASAMDNQNNNDNHDNNNEETA